MWHIFKADGDLQMLQQPVNSASSAMVWAWSTEVAAKIATECTKNVLLITSTAVHCTVVTAHRHRPIQNSTLSICSFLTNLNKCNASKLHPTSPFSVSHYYIVLFFPSLMPNKFFPMMKSLNCLSSLLFTLMLIENGGRITL